MKIEEYREGLNKIQETANKAKGELAFRYAVEHNPHKKDDIISDGNIRIHIMESDVRIYSEGKSPGIPVCVFRGPVVGDETGEWKEIWQPNIIQE